MFQCKAKLRMLSILILFGLAGCANPFSTYYKGESDAQQSRFYVPEEGKPIIYTTDNVDRDLLALVRRGYWPIGNSSFNIGRNAVNDSQLLAQASKVGAHVVLVQSKYTNTVIGAVPLTVPNTSTSYSTGTATATGPGGTVNAYGSGTTTTYGSQTVMMPYSIDRADYLAVFFVKSKSRLGIYYTVVDPETRARIQTNAGVKVLEVSEGSPAFSADILPGDVLIAIDSDVVSSPDQFADLVDRYEGQQVTLKLNRSGEIIEKRVPIERVFPGQP
jgi:hypothetical protein